MYVRVHYIALFVALVCLLITWGISATIDAEYAKGGNSGCEIQAKVMSRQLETCIGNQATIAKLLDHCQNGVALTNSYIEKLEDVCHLKRLPKN